MGKKRKLEPKSTAAAVQVAPSLQPETLAAAPIPLKAVKEEQQPQEAGGEEEEEVEVEEEVEDEDEDEDESNPASIQALLDLFPKDQLVELLRDAAVAHGDVLDAVRRVADADPAQRKIFVHGLGWDATADTLTEAFSPYGEIEDLRVVTDRNTGKCKGYGFILFRHRSGARAALREPQKKIGNRNTACQLASLGPVPPGGAVNNPVPAPAPLQLQLPPVSEYTQRKIFVSNVGANIDPQKLLQFFKKYGEIEDGPLGLDKVTGKPKGFALFVYKTIESARKALEEPHKHFEGVVLHCQKAIDGPKNNKSGGPGGFYGAGASSGNKGAAGYGATSHSLPGSAGHAMSPLAPSLASLPGGIAAAPGVDPALGQALTALLATQGAGLSLNSILGVGANGSGMHQPGASGALGGSGVPGMPGGYIGGYGAAGGYGGAASGGPGRNYMGH
ncbi:RNA-binding protein P-like [Phragmites australis]|uniref:RNA-binding protein P-like n=1 Tax=Phragmites australis TaxID=29695 RepID=UPI002D77C783|nr:RNA-binding protein P-like [Phragmites australis]XP_062208024.1 RNA-binding protein P-like [Phragmites australis]XP_062208032.1 RNA-binding protein P-like [Phragmites australis]